VGSSISSQRTNPQHDGAESKLAGSPAGRRHYGVDLGQAKQVHDFLVDKGLKDVAQLQDQELVCFNTKDDMRDCVNKLASHNLHAAPVWDADRNEWVGLLDWKDFAAYVSKFIEANSHPSFDAQLLKMMQSQKLAVDLSQQNPYFPIFEDASIISVLSGFGPNGVHRRPVIAKDNPNKIISIVSQSTIITWLAQNKQELGPALERTIINVVAQETHSPYIKKLDLVCSVLEDTPMVDVLNVLVKNLITGVAVVDHAGKLLANISVSDLRYMVEKDLDNLLISAGEFLQHLPKRPLVTCAPNATLGEVIDKLAQQHVSRIYVTNSDNEPIAVITLTDIMSALLLIVTQEGEAAGTEPSRH